MSTIQALSPESQKEINEGINASAIIAMTNEAGKIIFVNQNFIEISGYSECELLGQDHRLINSGVHPKEFFADMWKIISQNKIWHGEICNRKKDGTLYWVDTIITVNHDSSGARQYMAIRFDITQRKKSEQKLAESLKVWQFALEGAGDGVWDWNISMGDVFLSEHLIKFLGYEEGELKGKIEEWGERIHPDDIERVMSNLRAHLAGEASYCNEHRLLCKDGSYKWILARGKVISWFPDGRPQRMVGIQTDLTKIKQSEQVLIQSSKLISLGEMSASIAHEINNPLAVIAGSIGSIYKNIENPEKIAIIAKNIQKSNERITKIINGLRKFSRISDDHYLTHDLSGIISEALILTEANARINHVTITTELHSGSLISCNEIEIEQVMVNLINNAIDAIKHLNEKWIKIEMLEVDQVIAIKITDSGKGIPEQNIKKLFTPFFTTKPVGEGTGLGLSISKSILDKHEATITVVPKLVNTCFEIGFKKAS